MLVKASIVSNTEQFVTKSKMRYADTMTKPLLHPPIVSVAVPTPFWEPLDYARNPKYTGVYEPGMRVSVPLGRRVVTGIVVGSKAQTDLDQSKIKPIQASMDNHPLWRPSGYALCEWATTYYRHPIGAAFADIIPAALRKGASTELDAQQRYQLTDAGRAHWLSGSKRAPKQREALAYLQEADGLLASDWPVSAATRSALIKKEWVCSSPVLPKKWSHAGRSTTLTLTQEQQDAVDALLSASGFSPFLLCGVTGSGKTEVYFHAMDRVLQAGQQVLFLVPEIALTPQTWRRVEAAFSVPVHVYHSGCTDKQRLTAWRAAGAGEAAILIGTRSAVFLPFQSLGLIVVDEEHDSSYKQQTGFRYNARDCALKRAQLDAIPIVLGSATPSLRTVYNAQKGRFQLLRLTKPACTPHRPKRVCMRLDPAHYQEGISEALKAKIQTHLDQKGQVMLFLNRRGFAPLYLCPACQFVASCDHCDAKLTYHRGREQLVCHHCDTRQSAMRHCPSCQRAEMLPYGLGTEQLEAATRSHFPDHRVLRVDRDTTSRRGALEASLDAIQAESVDIIIGTQMLAKGHHFPKLTCVVVINADQGFLSSDFRSAEQAAALIEQVSGRAGRESSCGEVILQTLQENNPYLHCLIEKGYWTLADELIREREAAGLPPKVAMAVISAESKNSATASDYLMQLKRRFPIGQGEWMGPMPAILSKRANWYRYQLCLMHGSASELQGLLARLTRTLPAVSHHALRLSVDVDPYTLG